MASFVISPFCGYGFGNGAMDVGNLPTKGENMALTDTRIRNLKAPQTGVAKYADGRGLTLLVTHTGTRTFYLRTRIDGRERMFRVGGYGEISLAEARRLAEEMRLRLRRGQPAKVEDVPTLADVAGDWLNLRRSEITPAHAADIGRRLEKDVFPRLGNLPLPDITAPMILETLRPVSDRAPETAKRLRQYLSAIFRHGAACGIVTADPAAFVGQALRRPVKKHFPAIVDPTAFAGLMQSLRDYYGAPDVRRALLFLVATAVRPGNVRSATWEEIDLQARTWTIPGPKMKNRRQHVVPLNSVACAVLAEIERERPGKEGFLFPGRAGRPLSENTLNTALKSLGYAGKHTSHSFRSSLSSMANEAGIARPDVIEAALAHAEKDDVRAAYNRADYEKEKRLLFDWWGSILETPFPKKKVNAGVFMVGMVGGMWPVFFSIFFKNLPDWVVENAYDALNCLLKAFETSGAAPLA